MIRERADLPTPTEPLMLAMVALMLQAEIAVRLGVDPDGSHTFHRAEAMLATGVRLDPVIRLRPGDGDAPRAVALLRTREYVRTVSPLATRLLKPSGWE